MAMFSAALRNSSDWRCMRCDRSFWPRTGRTWLWVLQPGHVGGVVGGGAGQGRVGAERGAAVGAADLVRVDEHRLVEERLVRVA